MNLDEFRKAMESDATVENEILLMLRRVIARCLKNTRTEFKG